MTTVDDELQTAISQHQAGRLAEAETIYRRITARDPAHAEALHLLGAVAHQTGRHEVAIGLMQRSIALAPSPVFLKNLSTVFNDLRRFAEAETCCREALWLDPDYAQAHYNLAIALLGLERFADAEASCRATLRLEPDFPEAQNNRGNALRALGRWGEAESCYREAIRLAPALAEPYSNLASLLRDRGRLDEAAACLRDFLARQPESPETLCDLGAVLQALQRFTEAETCYRQALALQPDQTRALLQLGNTLQSLERYEEAEVCYRELLRHEPDYLAALNNLGCALLSRDRLAEAEVCYRKALHVDPDHPETLNNFGNLLQKQGRFAEAEPLYRQALQRRPDYAEAKSNLGDALRNLARLEEAEALQREALRLRPDFPEGHNGLGHVLHGQGRWSEAIACYRTAIRLRPSFAEAHANLGMVLLQTGDFAEGWQEYEWRMAERGGLARKFPQPVWRGEDIGEKTLLIHAEQGLGDTLQFCRYVPAVSRRAKLIFEVPSPLGRLLASLNGQGQLVPQGKPLPAFDLHCPLMSLPLIFETRVETIPAQIPYLAAQPAEIAAWRQRLEPCPGLRVGLVWAGNPRLDNPGANAVDKRRSMAIDQLAPLAAIPGVTFVSLQKGAPVEQIKQSAFAGIMLDWTDELEDFADTAALVEALDLVIAVDTSIIHLVGALGKPIWMLNRFDGCWRWLLDRQDSPWYPSLLQFRQSAPGDWSSVIARVRDALRAIALRQTMTA